MRVLHIQCTYSEDIYIYVYTMQPTQQCSSTVGPSFNNNNNNNNKRKERKRVYS